MKTGRKSAGFTLIEIIMVVAIVAIIAVMAIPKYTDLRTSAEDNVVKSVQASIETTINLLEAQSMITGQQYTAQDVINNMQLQGITLTVEDL